MAVAAPSSSAGGSREGLIGAAAFYVDKVVSDPNIIGMKTLILDEYTTQVVAMVYSRTEVLEREVYLIQRLDASGREAMAHLKAAVFVRPTPDNVDLLVRELASPRHSEYHIFFSNVLPQDMLQRLARADEHEVVRQVQEYYGDFLAINEELFTVNVRGDLELRARADMHMVADGLLSVLLSQRRRPSQIRFTSSSETARELAELVQTKMASDSIFDFRHTDGPLLLILDRRDDPISALLTQWCYQAMVHELLGIRNNRVSLRGAPNVRKDLEEVVLSCTQDAFFARHRNSNFGDLGTAVRDLLQEYQQLAKLNENLTSIEDMQNFMERYPAFRSQSLNVSKHVAIMAELSRLVDANSLLDVSQLEQDMACGSADAGGHARELQRFLDAGLQVPDKLRLGILYALRYESPAVVRDVRSRLVSSGVPESRVQLLDAVLAYAGERRRGHPLWGRGIMSKLGRSLGSALHGVENVYTQHQPLLMGVLEDLAKGKLRDQNFPVAGGGGGPPPRPNDVVVFVVGGATFEEATKVAELNATGSMRVLLGGTHIHNSTSFLQDVSSWFGAQRRG